VVHGVDRAMDDAGAACGSDRCADGGGVDWLVLISGWGAALRLDAGMGLVGGGSVGGIVHVGLRGPANRPVECAECSSCGSSWCGAGGGMGTMDRESSLVEVVADPVTDGLIDAINTVLAAGRWEEVVVLALSLWEHAVAVGDMELAALVEDIRAIALDAVAHPSGDDGVIRVGDADGGRA